MPEMKEFKFDFENLKVYEKGLIFIDKVFVIYKKLNQEYKYSIGSNFIRAAMSITNNIAEGNDKKSKKDKNKYFGISSDSARECVSVLNVLSRQNLIDNKVCLELRQDVREITSMIRSFIENNQE